MLHGFKGFKDWGFFPWVAERLVAAGHAVVTFNFSGSGMGGGPPASAPGRERFTELEAFARNTFSAELEDLADMVGRVRSGELVPRPPRSLALLGFSRGGADAVLHAAGHGGVDALVTWAAPARFDRWSEATLREWREAGRIHVLDGRTGQQLPLDLALLEDFEANREALDVTAAAARVEAPWLVVHGTEDETVDVEEARALAGRAPRVRLLLVESAGHTFSAVHPFAGPAPALETAMDATLDHLRRHLSS